MSSTITEPLAAFAPQHLNWATIPIEHPGAGIQRQMVIGQNLMICRFRFQPHLETPRHRHSHEQMSIVMSGRVRFFVEGQERICSAGDILQFPSNCLHGATMMGEEVVLIDVFTPLRQDFLNEK
ncbi:MAG TPA: cupin domain-containing protein [Pyrinomonadaceae bacterium]|jgi:quercetin dioxygenase-like cupin family protein|nr:cupin domain-containing protein [Pyrinomonadaceae bacterium]